MKIQVRDLKPNPFRRINEYPIDKEKVESLKASIEDTTFWDNILARENNGGFEIAYGHHRLIALRELKIKEIDIPIRDIDDGMMIKIMANENRDTYKANRAIMVETVKVARDWLREQMDKGWELADKSIIQLFKNKASFSQAKCQDVGRDVIKSFLNGDWKDWEIQEALAQLDDEDVSQEALQPFEKLSTAGEARKAMKAYNVPKQRQKAISKILVKEETPVKEFHSKVAEIAKAEGWKKPKEEFPQIKMPPHLDQRIEEILATIGSLSSKFAKVKGYLSYIKNKRLISTLKTHANILQATLDEILREIGGMTDGNL